MSRPQTPAPLWKKPIGAITGLLPDRWPIRWRVAAVSAVLTLVIRACFAAVVGRLAGDRLRGDFRDELRAAAGELAFSLQVEPRSPLPPHVTGPDLQQFAMANDARIRVVTSDGSLLSATPGAPDLGEPHPGVEQIGGYEVATAPILTNRIDLPTVYVQYARNLTDVEDTIDRLWLFLITGALGGSVLAAVASMMVAGRALAPITRLTSAAREIGSRRDPSIELPIPETDDEVAELARTLDGMLGELESARAETDGALARQRQFVADASHELRTPLTSVVANLEMLTDERHGVRDGDCREAAASALRSAQRMNHLVTDLLLLARAESGRSTIRTECDLGKLGREAVEELAPQAGEHHLATEIDDGVVVTGSPNEIYRVIANLVVNAFTHTPAGTAVRLEIRRDGDVALIRVEDDGPGIPEELGDSVFDRFVHGLDRADCEGTGDTGIGLAIVRAVARDHGGEATVGRSPSDGAQFDVRLPLS